ncbi:MAG: metallophosphoesterase [Bacteroidales bacterium]|nr:metallophosphoesterase [Bacteroidales bacterium]
MEIIAFTDIHGRTDSFDRISGNIKSADLIVIAGDITHFGLEKDARAVLENIAQYNDSILVVAGNCDQTGVVKYLCSQEWNLHNEVKNINGYTFIGLGGSLPCPGKTPLEYSEEEYSLHIASISGKINAETQKILITHQPPANTVNDQVAAGQHVGSHIIRKFIETLQPIITFTGHIHEGIGIDTIGISKIINPGPFREGNYAYAKIIDGQIIDLDIRKI